MHAQMWSQLVRAVVTWSCDCVSLALCLLFLSRSSLLALSTLWWWQWSDQVSCTICSWLRTEHTRDLKYMQQHAWIQRGRGGEGREGKAGDAKHKASLLQCLVQWLPIIKTAWTNLHGNMRRWQWASVTISHLLKHQPVRLTLWIYVRT